ncbi:MAG: DUF5828 family protein [Thermoplasmata archaeon]
MVSEIEMTNAGFKYHGSWDDICNFARHLEIVFNKCVRNEDSIGRYHEWRPREEEDDKDLKVKTAKEADVRTKDCEREFSGTKEELRDVESDFIKSVYDIENGQNPREDIKDATKHIERLLEVKSIQSIRKMEDIIYTWIMLRFNPCYFDTDDFSVNLEGKDEDYFITFNISDEEKRNEIKSILKKEGF